ncbi:MAG: L-fuculose-phosphate aldolase [Thermoleophilaceae bacterium]|nr:L-fuculose-phosphate aldolase [Thermoleophilaceae bacterium]
MLLAEERRLIAEYGRRLVSDGLVVGTYGNISIREGDRIAITPHAVEYDQLSPELVCVVDADGRPLDGPLEPSSELPMHLRVHREHGDGALVHTHSPFATALSCVVDEIPAVHYLAGELGGPIPNTPFEPPGSERLAAAVAAALAHREGALLQSHGTVTIGTSLPEAYARSQILEFVAQVYYRARLICEPNDTLCKLIPKDSAHS